MSNQVFRDPLNKYSGAQFAEFALTVSQSTANNSEHTVITMVKTEDRQFDDAVAYASATGIWTVVKRAHYNISFVVPWAPDATGSRYSYLQYTPVGGTVQNYGYQTLNNIGASLATVASGTMTIKGFAGDTFKLITFQLSGGALDITGGGSQLRAKVAISLEV